MSKTVYLAHAVGDEHGQASGGAAGDQTGKEVRISAWYLNNKGWVVLRAKDREVAKKIAFDAREAADNPCIGYDQHDRSTLLHEAAKVGYACALVKTPCECDCSSLVRCCVLYAGIKVGSFSTATEVDALMKTGAFEKLDAAEYTTKPDKLMIGDILVTKTKGHTAVVLNDGKDADVTPEPDPEPEPEPQYSKVVYVKGGSVYVRTSDSVAGATIGVAHRGDKLPYLGTGDSGWYHVEFKGREGYISNKPRYTEVRYEHT